MLGVKAWLATYKASAMPTVLLLWSCKVSFMPPTWCDSFFPQTLKFLGEGVHLAVFKGYSMLCTRKSLLVSTGVHVGCWELNPDWPSAWQKPYLLFLSFWPSFFLKLLPGGYCILRYSIWQILSASMCCCWTAVIYEQYV